VKTTLGKLASRGVVTALVSLLTLSWPAFAAEPAKPAPPPAPPSPSAIPMTEVAKRAGEAANLVRDLAERLAPSSEIETIKKRLPGMHEHIDRGLADVTRILANQPTLDMIQDQQQLWHATRFETTAWLDALTRRATILDHALTRLTELREDWSRTSETARMSRAPDPILRQIDEVLGSIESAKAPLEAQRDTVLDLQSAIAEEVARSEGTLARLDQAQRLAVSGILSRGPAIWSAASWARARAVLPDRLREIAASHWSAVIEYVQDPSQAMGRHLAILAGLVVVFLAARGRVRQWGATGEGTSPATLVFERPFSATATLALLSVSSPWSPVPPMVRSLLVIVGLGPVIRVTRLAADPRLASEFYMLWALFVVDSVRGASAGLPVVEQMLLTLEMLAGILLMRRSLSGGSLRQLTTRRPETGRLAAYRSVAGLLVVAFSVALAAGLLGYLRLTRLLASSVLGGSALGLMLYASVQVGVGVAAFALRVWPLSLLRLVDHHRDLLETRVRQILVLGAIAGWAARMLDYVGLLQPALSLLSAIFTAPLGRGSIQISLGNIIEFVLTVWVAYLTSAFIRFVLREDVYPRTEIPRGISYAISSLLNYVIIALGFVLALGAVGMDLTRVTVLVGALGVGIGFGLQSVVNNFVSGLILLFERPVHVGDIVELSGLSGEVSRIGIRASTVRTWQGAEIIVPNAQLVSERVTNWTLSDRTRRIDLPVGVNYGSEPGKVVEVLESVARAHPHIMQAPAPRAVFKAFGDSSINFELRAWTNRFEQWPVIQTELAAAVYAGLHEAGMAFPFPQREVRLLSDGAVLPSPPASAPRPVSPGAERDS
jgi:potassium efflux system protein